MMEHYIKDIYVALIPKKDIARSNLKMVISKRLPKEIYRMLKKPNKTSMARALSATRFDQIHEQYCRIISRMPIASEFSNGFGKAVAILDYMGGKEDAFIPDKQEYKYRANAVIDEDTGKLMEYRDLLKDPKHREDWSRAAANEFGRLFNGVGKNKDGTQRVVGTNTCHWIKQSQVPRGKKVTYARTVVAIRTEKAEQKRVRITAGGDRPDYPGETSNDTASLDTTKILINSVLSTPGARMGAIDISNFYIHNDLTGFLLWRQYWRHFWGSFFTGAYLPQKSDLEPPTERQYKPFQKHVSSYQAKRSPRCFVSP
jgi:hypothetical protein